MRMLPAGTMLAVAVVAAPAIAQNVKITPVGSHPGELCANDRATIFEDPTGVRLLYDVGHTVTGGDDPRLGAIHAVLLSHAHGDHIGDQKLRAVGAGEFDGRGRCVAGC
jgi:L-ascorbate metabolism protein UlaG (beta-lactamase superfamily)